MRRLLLGLCIVLLVTVTGSLALAADAPHGAGATTAPHGSAAAAAHPAAQPVLPEESSLGGSMVILIAGLFLAAAIVGPVVRYHAPEEVPEASSHDEHGHGAHDAHGHRH